MIKPRSAIAILFFLGTMTSLQAYDLAREIKIVWDYDSKELYVSQGREQLSSPMTLVLLTEDKILLGLKTKALDYRKRFLIGYELLPPAAPYQVPAEIGSVIATSAPVKTGEEIKANLNLFVTEELPSGGKLLVIITEKDDNGKVVGTDKLVFKVKFSYPLFIPSTGLLFSNEANPDIAIEKTASGESVLLYKEKEKTGMANLRPKQDLIQFFSFRLREGLYLSAGFPLTLAKRIYENPHLGLSFYPGQNLAYLIHMGLSYHRELQILEASGYKENQPVGATLRREDIPTENRGHIRFYVGIAFRLR